MRSIAFKACFSDGYLTTNVNYCQIFSNDLQYVRVFYTRGFLTKDIGFERLSLLPSAKSVIFQSI